MSDQSRLPAGNPPWFGLEPATRHFLEIHETRAVAVAARTWRDLGDAVLLHAAGDRDPSFNRIAAVRWPADQDAFDRRLTESLALFAALDRRPHLWITPGVSAPADIAARLASNGFDDLGGRQTMLLVRTPNSTMAPGANVTIEHWHRTPEALIPSRATDLAMVIGESFGVDSRRWAALAMEVATAMRQDAFHACLVRVGGEPAATGQRFTFDGASYLSSIGTRPAWRRQGFGTLVTTELARGALVDDCPLIYLAVQPDALAAVEMYRRIGFAALGGVGIDMLLR